ncbi:hypothetical protein MP228_002862 [Amoeboaphelidium protococcarum]|nr:hypothetical protein MP228_002862 [Amoeboaphelidium protococcarum]
MSMDDIPQLEPIQQEDLLNDVEVEQQIPVTVITGYLGAGKTSLLGHILTSVGNEKRIAVILNDVGDARDIERDMLLHTIVQSRVIGQEYRPDIDAEDTDLANSNLAQESSTSTAIADPRSVLEDWVELRNGCLCCSLKNASVAALEAMVIKSRQKPTNSDGDQRPIEHVVIECSGLVDPTVVASMLWIDDALSSALKLNGVVCVVDAQQVMKLVDGDMDRSLMNPEVEWLRQIATADLLLLNKIDKIAFTDDKKLVQARQKLAKLNGLCDIVECQFGKIDLDRMFNLDAYDNNAVHLPEKYTQQDVQQQQRHAQDVVTIHLDGRTNKAISKSKFEQWIENALWESNFDIFRAKGVVYVQEDPSNQYVLQAVGQTYELIQSLPWRTSEGQQPLTRLMIVGRLSDHIQSALQESFYKLFQ